MATLCRANTQYGFNAPGLVGECFTEPQKHEILTHCWARVAEAGRGNIIVNKKMIFQTPRHGFSLFGCFRQKIGLIICKQADNCIGLPHGPESYMSRI